MPAFRRSRSIPRSRGRSRLRRILGWSLGLLLGVPLGLVGLVLVLVLIGTNTPPGRRLIEREAGSLSGGLVSIKGLHGRFPDALAIDCLTISDYAGPYATLDDLRLDWRPLRLIGLVARIDLVSIGQATIQRRPLANPHARPSQPGSSGSSLPNLGIDIRSIRIDRLTLGKDVAGLAASLGIDGHVRVQSIKPLLSGVSVATLPDSDVALRVRRLDQAGALALSAVTTPARLGLHLHVKDPRGGLVETLAGMPLLDPLTLTLDLDGPRRASALRLALAAGPATLDAHGTTDLLTRQFSIVAHGQAPAMQLRPGIGWKALALDADLSGTPQAPAGRGRLLLDELAAAGAGVNRLTASFAGGISGPATLHALAEGLRIPGPKPALFAATPLTLDATLHQEQPGRPIELRLYHALAQVTGRVFTAPDLHGTLGVTLPQLAPLAAAAGTPLDGHAAVAADFSYANRIGVLGLGGTIAITGGLPQASSLIGDQGQLGLTASLAGSDLRLYGLTLHGRAIDLTAAGSALSNVLDASFGLRLPDLQAASPALRGALSLKGSAQGPLADLAAHVEGSGELGTSSIPSGPLRFVADAAHLPKAPEGSVTLDGSLDRAPLTLAARLQRQPSGAAHLTLDRLGWKSASGHADLTLPAGAVLPVGSLDVRMTRLADLSRVVGQTVAGHLAASLRTSREASDGRPRLRIDLGGAVASRTLRIGRLALSGSVLDPVGSPEVDLALAANGLAASGITGNARVTARGPEKSLAVAASGAFEHVAGGPARIDAALVLDLPNKHVAISRFVAAVKGETVRLLAPVRVGFGSEIEINRLRASVAPASGGAAPALIDLAGKLSPRLDLTASVSNLTPALARPFAPTLDASGVIAAQARLTGTPTRPTGTIHLAAQSMHLRSGAGASLPPAGLEARADLAGTTARIVAQLEAGKQIGLTLGGTAPLSAAGMLDLHARGMVDLAVANAVLGAEGRQASGQLGLDITATGTPAAPVLAGQVRLSNGAIQDFAQGIRLTDITALVTARGKSISIDQFVAHAGAGTIDASGTVGALLPGMPVDLHITASKARPLSSDLLTAVLDMDITAKGEAASRLDVAGRIGIDSASINIPSGLPPSVAKLDVIRPGQKPPPPAPPGGGLVIGLDLALNAPGQIFVRGHGLDAELGGRLTVAGTTTAPVIQGGFDMRRGTFSLAGVNLTFTKGRVGFNGAGVTNKIDPSLDFTAESFVGDTVATLHVGGYADAPKITLFSTPPLPADQVLALILFQQSTTQLSPLQIASVAAALAELSGVGGGGPGVLGSVRSSLGLDRLAIGSGGANSTGTSVEAGKYVARGVYVGARQSTSGAGTQAQVQIDLTRRLKLDTVVGTGGAVTGTTTPENDPGSSVALKYQFQY